MRAAADLAALVLLDCIEGVERRVQAEAMSLAAIDERHRFTAH
jgi:hypothetical protein